MLARRETQPMRIRLFCLLLVFVMLVIIAPNSIGYAQAPEPTLQITGTDTRDFPTIRLDFKAQNLPTSLPPSISRFKVKENDQMITPDNLETNYVGIHFSLVINPEYSLTLSGVSGQQYYAEMIQAVKLIGPNPDHPQANRYSLHINPDISISELSNYDAWVEEIDAYQENQRKLTSSLDSLNNAITALENSESDLDTVLLYITPYLHPSILPGFFSLVERAAAINVPMHVWIVMDRGMLGSSYETNMRDALQTTSGSLSAFTGLEEVPDPTDYLTAKGNRYSLTYQSRIRQSGKVNVALEVEMADGVVLRSDVSGIDLRVEPARLSFINPPEKLELIQSSDGSLSPGSLPLEVLIEFPDGYPRGIVRSSLFVNGKEVQSNTAAPYGSFVVNLQDYHEADELRLEVRLEDQLGLQARSGPQSIQLDIFQPESPFKNAWYASYWLWLSLLALAGLIVFLIVRKPTKKASSEKSDPEKNEGKAEQALAAPTFVTLKSYGSLIKLDPDQTPSAEKPLLLVNEVTLIGRDPTKANLVLDHPSLEPLHAEIHFFNDGRIRITDFNSTSGTYVNFEPVTTHGNNLQHADLIHFGSLFFRFNSSTRTQSGTSNQKN